MAKVPGFTQQAPVSANLLPFVSDNNPLSALDRVCSFGQLKSHLGLLDSLDQLMVTGGTGTPVTLTLKVNCTIDQDLQRSADVNFETVTFGEFGQFKYQATDPALPPATYGKLYFKTDGKVYARNAEGQIFNLSGGGTGGAVTSVFGRTADVQAQAGDYDTSEVPENGNLYFTDPRALTAVGKVDQTVGFTLSGGTTVEVLDVKTDCAIDQDLQQSANVKFGQLTTNTILTDSGTLALRADNKVLDLRGTSIDQQTYVSFLYIENSSGSQTLLNAIDTPVIYGVNAGSGYGNGDLIIQPRVSAANSVYIAVKSNATTDAENHTRFSQTGALDLLKTGAAINFGGVATLSNIVASLAEGSDPATIAGRGQYYVKSDKPFFRSPGGTIYDLSDDATEPSHNDLAGLQGGTAGEYYHLNGVEHNFLAGQDQGVKTIDTPIFTKVGGGIDEDASSVSLDNTAPYNSGANQTFLRMRGIKNSLAEKASWFAMCAKKDNGTENDTRSQIVMSYNDGGDRIAVAPFIEVYGDTPPLARQFNPVKRQKWGDNTQGFQLGGDWAFGAPISANPLFGPTGLLIDTLAESVLILSSKMSASGAFTGIAAGISTDGSTSSVGAGLIFTHTSVTPGNPSMDARIYVNNNGTSILGLRIDEAGAIATFNVFEIPEIRMQGGWIRLSKLTDAQIQALPVDQGGIIFSTTSNYFVCSQDGANYRAFVTDPYNP